MATLAEQIAEHGRARAEARAAAREHVAALRRLAPRALKAGMEKKEFARLARISRTTLDEWVGGG
jgi:hypothetical protein